MKLTELASKPTLTKFIIDDEDTISSYGEQIEFFSLVPLPLDMFLRFQMRDSSDISVLIDVLKEVILDESGEQIMKDGRVIKDINLLLKVISKLTTEMGKLQGKS